MQILKPSMGESSDFDLVSHVPWEINTTSTSILDARTPIDLVTQTSPKGEVIIEYTSILKYSIEIPVETPTDTLRSILLQTLRRITNPQAISFPVNPAETLRSALILRCYFHISQGLSNYPLEEISLMPPFLPDKVSVNSTSALESWNSWSPLPQVSPSLCDPLLLLLFPVSGILDLWQCYSYLTPVIDDTDKKLDAFIYEAHAYDPPYNGCSKRYYCLYDNCVYNMGPVSVSEEGFGKHLESYHGVKLAFY
ncbi:hypothetical protein TWF788_011258 [Orbilia oligospora]|uniref:Uncharacterized protein n=1 Tax=Orbilia oligospora TaxID=2813651 RepID=A0A7C8Q1P1_ORBOL|nr:hypothetical protein TWF788_011258 [Orbilia oligospora]